MTRRDIHRVFGWVVVGLCAAAAAAGAQQPQNQVRVPITEPARPALVSLRFFMGGITVRGTSRQDMLITTRGQGSPGPDGMRQLAQRPAFSIEEDRNRVTIEPEKTDRAMVFELEVPSRTNLKLELDTGEILVEGVEGELEIQNANGPITLNRVGGAILANSTNHHVKATVTSLSTGRPTAFSSLNGHVDVTFPASLKANLKLVANKGSVFTDFDITPLEVVLNPVRTMKSDGGVRLEINRETYGAVNGGGPEVELRTFNGNIYVRRGQ